MDKDYRITPLTDSLTHEGNKVVFNAPTLASEIKQDLTFRTFRDTEEVLLYKGGVYRPGGESVIKEEAARRLEEFTTSHRVNETLEVVRFGTYVDRTEFNRRPGIVNVKNGLLDIGSLELRPHTPDSLSTIQLPVEYDPEADCPVIKQFLKGILKSKDILIIEELLGYFLQPEYNVQRAFLLVGSGANGKSTLIELIRSFLGRENCTSVSLQSLEENRFASSNLFGKLANLYADLPPIALKNAGMFKMLTGGDTVSAEKKFRDSFSFVNEAKLVFSANKPPIVDDDSVAFWRRWVIIDFPHQFTGGEADKNLLRKLTTEEELSGMLNLAVKGIHRLSRNGDFSYGESAEEVRERYIRATNPVYAFVQDRCTVESAAWISKEQLYEAFLVFCKAAGIPSMEKKAFGRALKARYSGQIREQRHSDVYGWQGVRVQSVQTVGTSSNLSVIKQDDNKIEKHPTVPTGPPIPFIPEPTDRDRCYDYRCFEVGDKVLVSLGKTGIVAAEETAQTVDRHGYGRFHSAKFDATVVFVREGHDYDPQGGEVVFTDSEINRFYEWSGSQSLPEEFWRGVVERKKSGQELSLLGIVALIQGAREVHFC